MPTSPVKTTPSKKIKSAVSDYDIFTTGNTGYWPFLEVLIRSIELNAPNCNQVYVGDIGMDEPYTATYDRDNVTRLFQAGLEAAYDGTHQAGWVSAVNHKTSWLNKLLGAVNDDRPLIMIDNDTFITKDLAPLIDPQYDLQVTKWEGATNPEGNGGPGRFWRNDVPGPHGEKLACTCIASFMIINNRKKVQHFVQKWMAIMNEMRIAKIAYPHETPALNWQLQEDETDGLKVGYLKEREVCVDRGFNVEDRRVPEESYSVHFKSDGSNKYGARLNYLSRVLAIRFADGKHFRPEDYIEPTLYQKWLDAHPQ